MNNINKPISMVIKETERKLINVCNESGLSPTILDLIVRGVHANVHSLAERQAAEEEASYVKMLEEASQKADIVTDKNVDKVSVNKKI